MGWGPFSQDSKSTSYNINTADNRNSNNVYGGIGLTGNAAIAFMRQLNDLWNNTGNNVGRTLGSLAQSSERVQRSAFDFSAYSIDRQATMFERTAIQSTSTLNGLINAVRDFGQRTISASTGQATPLQNLAGASQYSLAGTGGDANSSSTIMVIGVIIALVALFKDGGK